MDPREAIFEACLLRFRPIMMTTSAAMLGALPLALSFGDGGELRRPLGISIVGGLMVSQMLTLYTTPVVYLYLDRFRLCGATALAASLPGACREPRACGMKLAPTGCRHWSAACAVRAAACMVGPDYSSPIAPMSAGIQGTAAAGRPASRKTRADKGAWWSIYHDPELDRLERKVEVSNQTVKAVRGAVSQCGRAGGRSARRICFP